MTRRWYGKVGVGETVEVKKGVWRPRIMEYYYRGDIIVYSRRMQNQSYSTNDDLQITAKLSILADEYLSVHCATIKYVEFMGALWKVDDISPEDHRLVLTLGGVYNDNSDE